MAKHMLAVGTTEQLRRSHGDAYHVHLVAKSAPNTSPEEMARLRDWSLQQFPGAVVEERMYHGQMRFAVPAHTQPQASRETFNVKSGLEKVVETRSEDVTDREKTSRGGIAGLITVLEENKEILGLEHYSVSPTTLDTVFLNIVEKHNVEEENYASPPTSSGNSWSKIFTFWRRK